MMFRVAFLGALLLAACSDRPLPYPPEWPDAATRPDMAEMVDAAPPLPDVAECQATSPVEYLLSTQCAEVVGCCLGGVMCGPGWVCTGGRCCLESEKWRREHPTPDGGGP